MLAPGEFDINLPNWSRATAVEGNSLSLKALEYIYPGIVAAQAIHAAVEFRIPDLLAQNSRSAAELAAESGAHAPALERLLRALTSIGIFQRLQDGRYANSPGSEILRRDHPQALWAEGMYLPSSFLWRPIGELSECMRTGETPFNRAFGKGFFTFLDEHPEEAEVFNRVMTQEIQWTAPLLLKACEFSRFKKVVDVGGGLGQFLSCVLKAVPGLEGVLFDRPEVVAGAQARLERDFGSRVAVAGGDFFKEVPEGGDAYLLRRVIHNWDDEKAHRILSNVRAAIRSEGRLILIDGLIDSATRPAGLMDLMMFVLGGKERTESEFRNLVQHAGFSIRRIASAGAYFVIECTPQ